MQFQQIDRNDAEKVYAAVYNVSGATASAGASVYYVVTSGDGISVSNAGTIRKWTFAGVLPRALSDSSYGKAQVYGICSAYMVLADSTVSATPGTQLNAVNSADYLKDFATAQVFSATSGSALWTGGNNWPFVTLMDTFASAASANTTPTLKTVFVRAM